jgi:hypothetical protein
MMMMMMMMMMICASDSFLSPHVLALHLLDICIGYLPLHTLVKTNNCLSSIFIFHIHTEMFQNPQHF